MVGTPAYAGVRRRVKMAEGMKKLDAEEDFGEESPAGNPLTLDYEEMDGNLEGPTHGSEPIVPISELRKVRAEAAKYRKRLRQLESRMEKEKREAELAKMEETDRLKAIAEEAEAKAKALKERADVVAKRAAIINAASALGFHNPKDAASIIDLGQIEVNDDGTVDEEKTNELVRLLAESKPYLIGRQDGDTGGAPALPGGFGPTNPPSSNWPRPKLRSKDQIEQLKQQSSEAMRSGKMAAAVRLYNRAWEMERGMKKK